MDLIGYYIFSTETNNNERDAAARMFGSRYGILEEAGTGMAAGPLACYLFDLPKIKKEGHQMQQGQYMNEPSLRLLIVDLKM